MGEKEKKDKRIDIRMSTDEYRDLRYMMFETGKSQSDIVREALKIYKNIVRNS